MRHAPIASPSARLRRRHRLGNHGAADLDRRARPPPCGPPSPRDKRLRPRLRPRRLRLWPVVHRGARQADAAVALAQGPRLRHLCADAGLIVEDEEDFGSLHWAGEPGLVALRFGDDVRPMGGARQPRPLAVTGGLRRRAGLSGAERLAAGQVGLAGRGGAY
jgi:hypothetical protein